MISVVVLLVMPIIGVAEAVGRWLPTHLAGALGALPAGAAEVSDYAGAAVVTAIASAFSCGWRGAWRNVANCEKAWLQPLTTPSGRSRATRAASPACSHTSATSSTSL
jgi:hypothetical protein